MGNPFTPGEVRRLQAGCFAAEEAFKAHFGSIEAPLPPLLTDPALFRAAAETGILRFDILGNHPFVVPKDHRALVSAEHVARADRGFSAASRNIHNELRHGKAGGMAPQMLDDLYSLTDRSPEMGDSP